MATIDGTLHQAVLKRACGVCEACLCADATEILALAPELGPYPSAWLFRGVCTPCRVRFEAEHDDWYSPERARH
jgi:hypothetical protein